LGFAKKRLPLSRLAGLTIAVSAQSRSDDARVRFHLMLFSLVYAAAVTHVLSVAVEINIVSKAHPALVGSHHSTD
jgi:hypothetical protein